MKPTETQLEVAAVLKNAGPSTIDEIASEIGASYETARAQIVRLADLGMIESALERTSGAGRPASRWQLTLDGEHLFPKQYGSLAVDLLAVLSEELTPSRLDDVLGSIVDQKVVAWLPTLEDANIETRLEALTSIYAEDDPFVTVERDEDGLRLVERNCPFLDVALHHPALCGLTINTLSRVLGRQVVREGSFQAGDGRCVFRVTDEPRTSAKFERESPAAH